MSRPSVKPRQLEQLFQNLEDCQITSAEHTQLMGLLRKDKEVRSAYIDHMEFVGQLHATAEAHAELRGAQSIAHEVPPSRQFLRSLMAAAAVLLLAAVALTFFHGPSTPHAGIVTGPNTSWSFATGGLDSTSGFLPGSTIVLNHGTLDIQLGTGNRLILEGPAELRVISPKLLDLPAGRLWARAEDGQLTVRTERLKIIDLGTEFGVIASDVLGEEIHVKEGSVKVEPKHPSLEPINLVSGEAARANAIGKLRRVPFTSVGFLTELPPVVPYQHWSFDKTSDVSISSSGMGVEAADMGVYSVDRKSDLPVNQTTGRFGQALELNEAASYAKSGYAGIEGGVARTVAFWIKGERQKSEDNSGLTMIAWGLPTEFGTKWRLTVARSGRSMGTVWGGGWAASKLEKGSSILDGNWHHLAYVFTGGYTPEGNPEILHYLDGKTIDVKFTGPANPVNTECSAKHSRSLTLGAQIISKPSPATFTGSIDELYVFRGVMEAGQIRSLYESNTVLGRPTPDTTSSE